MSWLMPNRFQAAERARLSALVAESVQERERAVEVATQVAIQTDADQQRVSATIDAIRERIALQQKRAAARRSATTLDARARLILGDMLDDASGRRG